MRMKNAVTVRLDNAQYEKLTKLANLFGIRKRQVIKELIEKYYEECDDKHFWDILDIEYKDDCICPVRRIKRTAEEMLIDDVVRLDISIK